MKNLHAVIMAGGSGTRFWPLSRRARPKQFLALGGGEPLLAATLGRLPPLVPVERAWVVCGRDHARAVRRLLPALPAANLLVEPCARNTAPCVGLAALHVARRDPRAVVAMLPADHHVGKPAAFRQALRAAAGLAADGAVVTIGVKPSRPETGYGYLKLGPPLTPGAPAMKRRGGRASPRVDEKLPAGGVKKSPGRSVDGFPARSVEKFVEKPDAATAQRYLERGDHLWNAGMFVFRADVILEEIRRSLPALAAELDVIAAALGTRREARVLAEAFPRCPSISIDYGVMERCQRIAVVPADFGWSDVGSFASLPEVRARDAAGNVVEGAALVLGGGRNNVVLAQPGRALAVIGLDDVVVVDAGDAVLVCHRERAQDVRMAVDELKRLGREDLL